MRKVWLKETQKVMNHYRQKVGLLYEVLMLNLLTLKEMKTVGEINNVEATPINFGSTNICPYRVQAPRLKFDFFGEFVAHL